MRATFLMIFKCTIIDYSHSIVQQISWTYLSHLIETLCPLIRNCPLTSTTSFSPSPGKLHSTLWFYEFNSVRYLIYWNHAVFVFLCPWGSSMLLHFVLKEMSAPPSLLKPYSQPSNRNNSNVHQQMNGWRKSDIYIQWSTSHPWKRRNLHVH